MRVERVVRCESGCDGKGEGRLLLRLFFFVAVSRVERGNDEESQREKCRSSFLLLHAFYKR